MKRILVLCVALVMLLCGCAPDAARPTDDTPQPVTDPVNEFALGGTMPEMTFYTPEGQAMKLSQLLAEKKLVVLNYWFADCIWCQREFPAMEQAYRQYGQDVEIVALNPADSATVIRDFQQQYDLSFPMVSCPGLWAEEMGVRGYPTSIFIDRDGVVCLIHAGAITDAQTFYKLFDYFTAENYERQVFGSITELLR